MLTGWKIVDRLLWESEHLDLEEDELEDAESNEVCHRSPVYAFKSKVSNLSSRLDIKILSIASHSFGRWTTLRSS